MSNVYPFYNRKNGIFFMNFGYEASRVLILIHGSNSRKKCSIIGYSNDFVFF